MVQGMPGRLMAAEINEQPALWEARLADQRPIAEIAERLRAASPRFVLLAARGTSDHAALYAKYLIEIYHGLPAGLASPSTMTVYEARPDFRDVLLVAISQSGESPDLVRTTEVARAGGALCLAVTNNPDSPLADAAELHLSLAAGQERAVAATKSYTAQLLALYLLSALWRGSGSEAARRLPELGQAVLARNNELQSLAARYRFATRLVTTARGFSYTTAREAALKLMETSYVAAQAFSGADLLHGPLAMLDPLVPVLAVIPEGAGGDAMRQALPRLRSARADLFVVGHKHAVADADAGFVLPEGVNEEVSPLLEILPLQLLALHLAAARGEDPDAPRGLRKVTATL